MTGNVRIEDLPGGLVWTSSSLAGNCVETASLGDAVAVRHSRELTGTALVFSVAEWAAFVSGIERGEHRYQS